jgi:ADP-ribose pyrophosphatase YjhB (NUDIX family)
MKQKEILIAGATVYKKQDDKVLWFIVKQNDDNGWEIPKTAVRRGESSVRAVIRQMGEQGGMRTKVLEETGRNVGSVIINGKVVPQRYIYYLLLQRGDNEVLGFVEYDWVDYNKAIKKIENKKEQKMIEKARDLMKEIQKTRKVDEERWDDEEEEFATEGEEPESTVS